MIIRESENLINGDIYLKKLLSNESIDFLFEIFLVIKRISIKLNFRNLKKIYIFLMSLFLYLKNIQ